MTTTFTLEELLLNARAVYAQRYEQEQAKPEPFRNTVTSLRGVLTGIDTALRWNNIYRRVALGLDDLPLPEPQFYEDQ